MVALGLTQRRLLQKGSDSVFDNVGDGAGLVEDWDIGGGRLGSCLGLCLVLKSTMWSMKAWRGLRLTYGLGALGKQVLLLDGGLGNLGLDRGQAGRHNLNLG